MKNTVIEDYIKMVQQQICDLTQTGDFIESLHEELFDYVENNPKCTLDEVINNFGKPEDIAKEFLLEAGDFEPKKMAKAKKKKKFIIAGLIILLAISIIHTINMHGHTQAKASDVITIYE